MADVVIDASALVDLLVGTAPAAAVQQRLRGHRMLAPAHLDAEVISALGRLARAGDITTRHAARRIERLTVAPITRRPLPPLLRGAWRRRHKLRLVDALYVELSAQLGEVALVTTDRGLASAYRAAELIAP